MKRLSFVLPLMFLPFFSHVLAQPNDCQTFSSSGRKTISVPNSYGGYYVVGFGARDQAVYDLLSIFASRESPDGGSEVRLSISHQDLPVELPTGTVNGLQFELGDGTGSSVDFWITLANPEAACALQATASIVPSRSAFPTSPTPAVSNSSGPNPNHDNSGLALAAGITVAVAGVCLVFLARFASKK